MKKLSKSALTAALLMAASGGMVAAPQALAQKPKKEKPQQVSEAFRTPYQAAEKAMQANDNPTAEAQLPAAEAAASSDFEKYLSQRLRLSLEARKNNAAGIASTLDLLLNNPNTPATDLPNFYVLRASLALDAKQPQVALPLLQKARELGSTNPDLPILFARANIEGGNPAAGAAEMQRMIEAEKAAGRKPSDSWYAYVVKALYDSGNKAATLDWARRELADYPTDKNWKKVIVLYRDSVKGAGLSKNFNVDLYRLQLAARAMSSEGDYFDYANATVDLGLPWEAVRVVGLARSAGAIRQAAGSFTRVEQLAQQRVSSEGSLDPVERLARTEKNGSRASQTADAYLASGNYAKAIELYQLALTKGVTNTDETNMGLGIALAQAGRKPEAREAFAKVATAPAKDIAQLWTVWLDNGSAPATATAPAAPAQQ